MSTKSISMRRIIYLSLLLVIPFLVKADHGRNSLNGKWISPFHGSQIKLKVKRSKIRVKNLTRRGWTTFRPAQRGTFYDQDGNMIRLRNRHELIYRSNCSSNRVRFVKKGHNHHNHNCSSACSIGYDFFDYDERNQADDYYGNFDDNGWNQQYDDYGYNRNRNTYQSADIRGTSSRIDGKYYVREIDEVVVIRRTNDGLRAKRGNRDWVYYRQNRLRKNEYVDISGNTYLVRSDGSVRWRSRSGKVTLNLST